MGLSIMKHNLLGAVSTIALGAAFGIGAPGAANASYTLAGTGLVCTGLITDTSGSCTETVSATTTGKDFNGVALTLDKWYAPQAGDKLASVSYTPGGNTTVQGTLTNSGTGTAHGSFLVGKDQFTFAGGNPSDFLVPTLIKFPGFNGGFSSGTVTLAPGETSPFNKSQPFTAGPFSGTPVAGYIGPAGSQFTALVTTSTSGGATSTPAAFTANATINESAFITITYNFTTPPPPPPPPSPTPEPASLALLGVGLAGLGAIRRRRKA
jgi:hypothetical protein